MRIGLSDAARRDLAFRCRRAVLETRRNRWTSWLEGGLWSRIPRPLEARLAAGALAALLVLVSVVWMAQHEATRPEATMASDSWSETLPAVQLVSVAPTAAGGVTLEWRDGNQSVYKVLRSTNPRDFCGAEAHAVQGNRWTDESPAPGEVVYYRVEQAF